MSTDTTLKTVPRWAATMERHHGDLAGHVILDDAARVKDAWHWDAGTGRLTVLVERWRHGGPSSIEVFRHGTRLFEVRADTAFSDAQVEDALYLAGLLSRDGETS